MDHFKALSKLETLSIQIEAIIWIASTKDFNNLATDLIETHRMSFHHAEKVFSKVPIGELVEAFDIKDMSCLIENHLGLLAVLKMPLLTNFSNTGIGQVTSCFVKNEGITSIAFAYGDTLDELLDSIIKIENDFVEFFKKNY